MKTDDRINKARLATKICGLTNAENIIEIQALNPEIMGFIFYQASPRYVGKFRDPKFISVVKAIPQYIKRCGVFVDANLVDILEASRSFDLSYIQLHGSETPAFCQGLKTISNLKIIKAFGIHENFDFKGLMAYDSVVDYYLFDTKTVLRGGSGKSFDWSILAHYTDAKPFFLSGGIGIDNLDDIKNLSEEEKSMLDARLIALDVNSKLESSPGIKDPQLVKQFIDAKNELFRR